MTIIKEARLSYLDALPSNFGALLLGRNLSNENQIFSANHKRMKFLIELNFMNIAILMRPLNGTATFTSRAFFLIFRSPLVNRS